MNTTTAPNEDQLQEPVADAAPEQEEDFLAGYKACDLSGDGTCEACQ